MGSKMRVMFDVKDEKGKEIVWKEWGWELMFMMDKGRRLVVFVFGFCEIDKN